MGGKEPFCHLFRNRLSLPRAIALGKGAACRSSQGKEDPVCMQKPEGNFAGLRIAGQSDTAGTAFMASSGEKIL